MKIYLKKKHDSTDKDPLVVMVKEPVYFCQKVAIGGCLDLSEDLAYAIMGDKRYKGLFSTDKVSEVKVAAKPVAAGKTTVKTAPKNKSLKAYADKTAAAETEV